MHCPGSSGTRGDVDPKHPLMMGFTLRFPLVQATLSFTFHKYEGRWATLYTEESDGPEGHVRVETIVDAPPIAPDSYPRAVMVVINGVDRTSDLGGPFYSGVIGLDITPYLKAAFNEIQFQAARPGGLEAKVEYVEEWPDRT